MITFNQYFITINNEKEKIKNENKPTFESDNWIVLEPKSYQDFCEYFTIDETNFSIRNNRGCIFMIINKHDGNKNCWLYYINQQKMFLKDINNERIELGGFKIENPELQTFLDTIENKKGVN